MKLWITDATIGSITRAEAQQSFYGIPADDLPDEWVRQMLLLDRLFIAQGRFLEQLKYIYSTRSKVERPEPTGEYKAWLDGAVVKGSKRGRKATEAPSSSKSPKQPKPAADTTSKSTTKPTP